MLTIVYYLQAQYGWIQHDYGHHSVFTDTKWNHFVQYIIMCLCKVSSDSVGLKIHFKKARYISEKLHSVAILIDFFLISDHYSDENCQF